MKKTIFELFSHPPAVRFEERKGLILMKGAVKFEGKGASL